MYYILSIYTFFIRIKKFVPYTGTNGIISLILLEYCTVLVKTCMPRVLRRFLRRTSGNLSGPLVLV